MISRVACSALWLTLVGVGAAAQADSDVATFLGRAQAGSGRYRDPRAALADGYHAIGVEAPAMGQHWVQPGLLVAGHLDPDRPPILEYVTIRGQPVLVGVAYALLLAPNEAPPDAPAGRSAWHSHGNDIDAESLRLAHEDDPAAATQERVAVLHVWVWSANPAGPFTPLNWTLPYLRAGLEPPPSPGADAKALSLTNGGAAFWEAALTRALELGDKDQFALHRVLSAYADSVARWSDLRARGPVLSDADRAWLQAVWHRLRSATEAAVAAPEREQLRMLTGP